MVVFVDSLEYTFLECRLVGSSVGCVLSVYIGVVLLTVAVCMCECKFKMLVFEADKRIEPAVTKSLFNKVHKTVLRPDYLLVEVEGKAFVEVGIVPKPLCYELLVVCVFTED